MSNIPELYGFVWIECIKKYAKELKKSLPDLGYLERLEVAARQFAGKRNYNECRKLHEKHLLSYRDVEGRSDEDLVHYWSCSFCNFSFNLELKEDKREHQRRHKLFEAAYIKTGYNPDDYALREKKKRVAQADFYHLPANNSNEAARLEAAMTVYRRFFDRSFESAIVCEYWEEHPPFDQYVAMLDIANLAELEDYMHTKFGTLKGHIPPGQTYWTPKNGVWFY